MNDRASQLEVICHHASVALFVTDPQLRCTYMNPAAERLIGYSLAEVQGVPLPRVLTCSCGCRSDDVAACHLFEAMRSNRREQGEDVCLRRDGQTFHIAYLAVPIEGPDGPIGLMVELQDISERKRKEQHQRFLTEIGKDFDRLTGPEQLMQTVGAKLCHHLGVSSCTFGLIDPQAGLLTIREAWQGQQQPSLRRTFRLADYHTEAFMRASGEGQTMVVDDTETASHHTHPRVHEPLDIRAYVTVPGFRDGVWSYQLSVISAQSRAWRPDEVALIEAFAQRVFPRFERAQAQQALQESEARYRQLFEAIDQGFCVLKVLFDAQGHPVDLLFLTTNPAFAEHTGLRQAAGRRIKELVPNIEQSWLDTYASVAHTNEPARFVRTSEAMGRWFDVEAFRTGAPEEHLVALLFTDITKQKQAEDALYRAHQQLLEADRSKDDFLAMLAHELRNPLAALQAAVVWLERHREEGVPPAKLAMLGRQTGMLNTLVDELLDVSRVTRGLVTLRAAPLDLRQVVHCALESTQALLLARHHHLQVRLPDAPVPVQGDAVRLEQVLVNLLNNACKYTDPHGAIELSLAVEDGQAILRVRDNGIGISAEMLPRVFGLFTQAERGLDRSLGGLGLGLTITRHLVEQHGGRIEAHSAGLGQGAEFIVRLSVIEQVPLSAQAATQSEVTRQRVLLVDDNRDIAETVALLLEDVGYEVQVAFNGPDALALAETFHPQVVLLDLGLPGMDGYEVARRLRQRPAMADVALCALSGYGGQAASERSRAAGFDRHLTKPVDLATLQSVIAGFVPR